jgi:hypothetical protein
MKTPMQEMFDQLKASRKDEYGLAFAIDMLLKNEQALLEKEKEQMLKTFTESRFISRECAVWNCEGDRRKWESFEHYYNETFNTKEK